MIEVNLFLDDDKKVFEKEMILMKLFFEELLIKVIICMDYVGYLNGLWSVVCFNDDKIWLSGMNNIISFYNF